MFRQAEYRSKKKELLHVELFNGSEFEAYLFLAQDERMSDLLNDNRKFLPFEHLECGATKLVAKEAISVITPKDKASRRVKDNGMKSENPYRVLGVAPGADFEEVKRHYKEKAREYHPDRFSNDQVPVEMIEFANQMMSRINQAFQEIRSERKEELGRQSA